MQNYKNHIRYYIPHHFVFYPVIGFLIAVSVRQAITDKNNTLLWTFIAIGFFMIGWLSFMLRQHYALTIQNRVVVLEIRFRYYMLTHRRLDLLEERLSFGQLAAIRFAADDELLALVDRVLSEHLSPDQIKKSIKNWMPDHKRV